MSEPSRSIVSLEIGGTYIDAWDGYQVDLDMLRPGSPWTFSIWHADAQRSTWEAAIAAAKAFARVTLSIDGCVVLDGLLRRVRVIHSERGATLVLSGLDLVGALSEAHADPSRSFKGLSLQATIEQLVALVSVPVELSEAAAAVGTQRGLRPPRRPTARRSSRPARVEQFRPKPGETVWQCIEAVCRRAGYLVWTERGASQDRLVLRVDRPRESGPPSFGFLWAYDESGVRATPGSNVLDADDDLNTLNVPSSVTVFADSPRGDATSARLARQVENDRLGGARYAFLIPQSPRFSVSARARSIADAQREATRAIGDANAGLDAYSCTVQGHTQERGGTRYLYNINEIALVRDEFTGRDEHMLITSVSFTGSADEGQRTRVRCVPLGAIKCEPQEA